MFARMETTCCWSCKSPSFSQACSSSRGDSFASSSRSHNKPCCALARALPHVFPRLSLSGRRRLSAALAPNKQTELNRLTDGPNPFISIIRFGPGASCFLLLLLLLLDPLSRGEQTSKQHDTELIFRAFHIQCPVWAVFTLAARKIPPASKLQTTTELGPTR